MYRIPGSEPIVQAQPSLPSFKTLLKSKAPGRTFRAKFPGSTAVNQNKYEIDTSIVDSCEIPLVTEVLDHMSCYAEQESASMKQQPLPSGFSSGMMLEVTNGSPRLWTPYGFRLQEPVYSYGSGYRNAPRETSPGGYFRYQNPGFAWRPAFRPMSSSGGLFRYRAPGGCCYCPQCVQGRLLQSQQSRPSPIAVIPDLNCPCPSCTSWFNELLLGSNPKVASEVELVPPVIDLPPSPTMENSAAQPEPENNSASQETTKVEECPIQGELAEDLEFRSEFPSTPLFDFERDFDLDVLIEDEVTIVK